MEIKKAYVVRTDESDDGCIMVFATSTTNAKLKAMATFDTCSYIDLRAVREPLADKYESIAIRDELQWDNEEHQRILSDEFGWQEL